jgi:hypothetical protein
MWIDALLGPGLIILMIVLVIWTAMAVIECATDWTGKASPRPYLRGRAGVLREVRGDFPQRLSLQEVGDDDLRDEQDAKYGEQSHTALLSAGLREFEKEQDALGILLELVAPPSAVLEGDQQGVRPEEQSDGEHREVLQIGSTNLEPATEGDAPSQEATAEPKAQDDKSDRHEHVSV